MSRPSGGGGKKSSTPASRGGGGPGAKVIDSRGRVSGVGGGGGGVRKSTPSGGSKKPAGRDKVYTCTYVCMYVIHLMHVQFYTCIHIVTKYLSESVSKAKGTISTSIMHQLILIQVYLAGH